MYSGGGEFEEGSTFQAQSRPNHQLSLCLRVVDEVWIQPKKARYAEGYPSIDRFSTNSKQLDWPMRPVNRKKEFELGVIDHGWSTFQPDYYEVYLKGTFLVLNIKKKNK
jgi:hypothetical protein